MREHRKLWVSLLAILTVAQALAAARSKKREHGEVYFANEEYKKLDRFEAHALDRADKAFNEGNFRQAGAEYETFLREYPRSIAIPYVVLRKARCMHKDDKRHEAIREYNEVLDYFPNVVRYAAAALYYQGLAHWENGDEAKAMKCWAKMARDKEYRKHRMAATAINKLAENLAAQGHAESAVAYFWQVAVDFRKTNHQAAHAARSKVAAYYIRENPNEPKFRRLYKEAYVRAARETSEEDLLKSFEYWDSVRDRVKRYGRFTAEQAELKKRYYAYWTQQLDGKFLDKDDYRIDVIDFQQAHEGSAANWIRRLDEQFTRNHKAGDYGRLVRWIGLFHAQKSKVMEYYNKLVFAKMTNAEIARLVQVLFEPVGDAKMARNAFGKLDLAKMPDGEKVALARWLWERDFELGKDLCMSLKEKSRGRHELLLYYHGKRDAKNGIPLADHLIGVPEYAASALWKKGELLEWTKKYPEAILVYRRVSDQPANLWRIAWCYERMGKVDKAVTQLREVENFFKQHCAQAAIRIAYVYKRAKIEKKCIAAFRRVLVKYPDTRESSDAHHQLEQMGVTRIRGGVRDDKEDR